MQFLDPAGKRRTRFWTDRQDRAAAQEYGQCQTGRSLNDAVPHRMIGPADHPAHFLFKLREKIVLRHLRHETAILLMDRIQ